ncbi:MAG TPA: hypothetical protein VHJ38_08560 [Nitrososphaeraceae archaeon]|jgi:hypothetical protein|nr:hypothetical protein [Nitrososphaeraceae archaeon]
MVSTKLLRVKLEMDIDIPTDLIENKNRLKLIEEGIIKSICKGLYEEGLSFHIRNSNFTLNKQDEINN